MTDARTSPLPPPTVVVHADVNLNLIDGSTIWLQSVCNCFLALGCGVVVLAREAVTNGVIVDPLIAAGVEVVDTQAVLGTPAGDRAPTPDLVVRALGFLNLMRAPLLFVVRGEAVLAQVVEDERLRPKIWGYWLKRPDPLAQNGDPAAQAVAARLARVLVQSPAAKAMLETVDRIDAARVLSLPPMVPPDAFEIVAERAAVPSRLVYSGKLDRNYNVEEFLSLQPALRERGVPAEVHVLGDKFNRAADDPGFIARMREKLAEPARATWHGGLPRRDAMDVMAGGDFGLCVRRAVYDNSLEVSTKLLEFCALGVPPILNRTQIHERMLGADYPYFAHDMDGVRDVVMRAQADPAAHEAVRARVREAVRGNTVAANAARIDAAMAADGLRRSAAPTRVRRRVVIAGHDLKFLAGVLPRLQANPALDIRIDQWRATAKHDEAKSRELAEWADVVFCEWCAGNAAFYTANKRAGQIVIVRLHRFEAFTPMPDRVDWAKVDRLIVVSGFFRDHCVRDYGVDPARIDVIPQYVDWPAFHRAKHPWADFTLGFVGVNTFFHKRVDRAIELLRQLRRDDPRWRLRIRSVMPWDLPWVWERPEEVEAHRATFARLAADAELAAHVLFDPPGPDMAEWFRHVGFIVSVSESEGCHTSVAEGMASGALPVVIDWPGAASVYPPEYVRADVSGLAAMVRDLAPTHAAPETRRAIAERARPFDIDCTRTALEALFLDLAPMET